VRLRLRADRRDLRDVLRREVLADALPAIARVEKAEDAAPAEVERRRLAGLQCGETKNGVFQLKRKRGSPSFGCGWRIFRSAVARFERTTTPPCDSA
jgi:hypothetical protein